ncbi:YjbQ family protein [Escherichia coli]
MLTDASLAVPLVGGRLALGTWQGIYLIEHRDRPHRREIVVSVLGA